MYHPPPNWRSFELIHVERKISCGGVYLDNLQYDMDTLACDLKFLNSRLLVRRFARPNPRLIDSCTGKC